MNIYACACVCVKHSFFFFFKTKEQTDTFIYLLFNKLKSLKGMDHMNSVSNGLKVKVKVTPSYLTLSNPMEFSRPEYWSG